MKATGCVLILVGVLLDTILNIAVISYFCKSIETDSGYAKWKKRTSNSIVNKICYVLSALYYKFIYFQFSKAFGSSHLAAPLSVPVRFFPITIITIVGILPSLLTITGCALISLDPTTVLLSGNYIQALDCLIVKIVGVILALASLKKADDFFDDMAAKNAGRDEMNHDTIEGLNDLNESYMVEHSVSYLGNKPTYEYEESDIAENLKPGKSRNTRSKVEVGDQMIKEEDEHDEGDAGLNKKGTSKVNENFNKERMKLEAEENEKVKE